MSNTQPIHFEKGQAYVGRDTSTPVDLSRPEWSGLKEVITEKGKISDGDYSWNSDTRQLMPAGGAGSKLP